MTDAIVASRPARPARPESEDSYQDVVDMFLALRQLPAGSREYARQRERIVVRCLPLAEHVARRFGQRGEQLDDSIQVARLGLLNAINRFDPAKGPSFIGFAIPTMMGEVRRHFRDYKPEHACAPALARAPRPDRQDHPRSGAEAGRAPTARDLSQVLGVRHEVVVECLVAGDAYRLESLDASVGHPSSGNNRSAADSIGDIDPHIDQITNREALRPLVEALPQRDREVLHMRFFESMTQSQIAERIDVSQMQVSRMLAGTLQSRVTSCNRPPVASIRRVGRAVLV